MAKEIDIVEISKVAVDSKQCIQDLMDTLGNHSSSSSSSASQLDCYTAIADSTIKKLKKFIGVLGRVGHARFRRSPVLPQPLAESSSASPTLVPTHLSLAPPPPPTSLPTLSLALDYAKPAGVTARKRKFIDETLSISPPISGNSSITADVSAVSRGRPLLSSSAKKKCNTSASGSRCQCPKKRRDLLRTSIRLPAISSRIADIPYDCYSWRKYGQKPITGSPHPSPYDCRAYYKCSSVRDCPAKKHVERAFDDFNMLVVTYEEEHQHVQHVGPGGDRTADAVVFET